MKSPRRGHHFPAAIALLFSLIPATVIAADIAILTVGATVLTRSDCRFSTGSSALDIGALDPASGVDVAATTSIGFRCVGSAPAVNFSISSDDGLYGTAPGAPRMRHATVPSEYLPYNLAHSPESGTILRGRRLTLTISGTVRGPDYRNARAGNYSDTVTLSILP